jgi:hypothetical protein
VKIGRFFSRAANATIKRRTRMIFILCIALWVGFAACADSDEDVSSNKSQTTDKSDITSTAYTSLSSETTEGETTTTPNHQSTATESGKKTVAEDGTTTKSNSAGTTTSTRSTTTTRPTATTPTKPIEIGIANYFPELPGYTTEYEISLLVDGIAREKGEYKLSVIPGDIHVDGNIVRATDQQKKQYAMFYVTATDNLTGRKAQLTITPKRWNVNFEDDFNGSSINSDIWTNFEYQYSNASVRDGVLTLLAERLNINGQIVYTSSGIRTRSKYSLKTGCFMARMKSPDRGGCNSAFWLMPEGRYTRDFFFMDTEFPDVGCSEIDIVEYSPFFGKEFPITQHFWDRYGGSHRSRSYWGKIDDFIYEDYHDYACIWESDGIYFYIDGKPVAANRFVNTHEDAVSAYIVLSTNSAKIHAGLEWLGPCTDDMFPFATSFDWVKTYY